MSVRTADSRIKAPMSIRTLIGTFFPGLILVSIQGRNAGSHLYNHYFMLSWIAVCFLAFLFVLYNALRKAGSLKWEADTLVVRNRTLSRTEIKAICIDGPLVGILPAGKVIVPVNLCFRFTEDQEQAMKRLMNWSEDNGIPLKYKRFAKWM